MYSVLLNIISTPCSAACKKPDLYRGTWQFFSYSISIFFVYKNPLKRGRGEEEFVLPFVSLPIYWFFSSPSAFLPFSVQVSIPLPVPLAYARVDLYQNLFRVIFSWLHIRFSKVARSFGEEKLSKITNNIHPCLIPSPKL